MSERTALLFPGQGSQSDGMGEDARRWCPDLFHLALEEPGGDLDAAASEARALGAKTARLAVRGGFHSPAMRVAVPALRSALDRIEVRTPQKPVYSGVIAAPFDD